MAPATTAAVADQVVVLHFNQALPSLEQSTCQLVPVAPQAPATQTMARTDQLRLSAQSLPMVEMVVDQVVAQAVHQSADQVQAETVVPASLSLVFLAEMVRPIRLLGHQSTMPAVAAVVAGLAILRVVQVVPVVVARAAD